MPKVLFSHAPLILALGKGTVPRLYVALEARDRFNGRFGIANRIKSKQRAKFSRSGPGFDDRAITGTQF